MKRSRTLLSIAAAACLLASATGCRGPDASVAAEVIPPDWPRHVDGQAAMGHVRALVAMGDRASGSAGNRKARAYLADALAARGLQPEEQVLRAPTPLGTIEFANVLAEIEGARPEFFLLGSHYDAKYLPGIEFEGANDSGSSTGLLLELAGELARVDRLPYSVRIAFFDGEECIERYGPDDGLVGSRALASHWAATGELTRMRGMILLDMVGDRNLTLTIPTNCDPGAVRLAYAAADRLGLRGHMTSLGSTLLDDHVPFAERGVRVINLIDFEYGTRPLANDFWHTRDDTLDNIAADSLDKVGRITLALLADWMAADLGREP